MEEVERSVEGGGMSVEGGAVKRRIRAIERTGAAANRSHSARDGRNVPLSSPRVRSSMQMTTHPTATAVQVAGRRAQTVKCRRRGENNRKWRATTPIDRR